MVAVTRGGGTPGETTTEPDGTTVCLLGGPYVRVRGQARAVPECAGRVLAHVALHGGRVSRRRVAGLLWPDASDDRAAGNLRSALWRLRTAAGAPVLEADKSAVRLAPDVTTDVDRVQGMARRLGTGQVEPSDLELGWWHPEVVDLLPGWDEEWVVLERERLRQQALHALERQSCLLVSLGRHGDAIEAALLAVEADPLRESAHRRLVEAHLAEGNVDEARRQVTVFGEALYRELGVRPSTALAELLPLPVRRAW